MPRFANFGRNQIFEPKSVHAPGSEQELLQILDANPGRRFRVIGRLHSWSPAAVAKDVLLDLRRLRQVTIHDNAGAPYAEIGAGCQIKEVLEKLNARGYTLCSLGLITEQSIAGAISTSTHGSGRHSTSHYVLGARLAHFDAQTGKATIREITDGDELRAARCSFGSLGVITSVRVAIRKQYQIEEHFQRYATLDEVLAREPEFDLQQFYLIPWRWDFFAQHRREVAVPRSKGAWLYRLYWTFGMDIGLHLAVWPLAKLLPSSCTKIFFRHIVPLTVPRGWKVVDRSDKQLTMEHELFRHIEIEVFVTCSRLHKAIDCLTWFLKVLGGEDAPPPDVIRTVAPDLPEELQIAAASGAYVHHYPICIRRVLPDDALISMTSDYNEPCYAISLISYAWPSRRDSFFRMSELLTKSMVTLFAARAHWGKYCPAGHTQMPQLYSRWNEFAVVRSRLDPDGAFSNDWARTFFHTAGD